VESLARAQDHADLLAHHYAAALDLVRASGGDAEPLTERARAAFHAAGDRAISLNAFASAVAHYRRALELTEEEDPHLLLRYGLARFVDTTTGEPELLRAVELLLTAREQEPAAEGQVALVELAWIGGDRDLTDERLEQLEEMTAGLPLSRAKAYALSTVSRYRMLSGRAEEAIRTGQEAIAMALELGADDIRVHALANVGPAKANNPGGDVEGGRADLEEAVELGNRIGSAEVLRAYVNLSSVLSRFDLREATRVHDEGLELATKLGHAPSLRFLRGERGTDSWYLGDWDDTVRRADEYEAEAAAGSPHYLLSNLLAMRGAIRVFRGDVDGGVADCRRALELARRGKDPQVMAPALGALAAVLVEAGRPDEARVYRDELFGDPVLRDLGLSPDAARSAIELGRAQELFGTLDEKESIWHAAMVAMIRGELVAAADIYAGASVLPDEALTRTWAAEVLISEGRRAEAEEQLELALAFWRSVGATRYVARAEALRARAATG
jgi:tetratricopeptide (TPR) repeat protein